MPIAKPDTARTPRGVPVVIAVLGNDEGGNLTISGYTQPTAGALTLNPDHTFTYTPAAAFEGVDGFAYTIRDGVGGTSEGDVRIFVARPNTTPVAANDMAAVQIGSGVTIPVLANDNDLDGDTLEIIGIDAPAHGTITVLPDQSIRYAPQADFAGIDSFTYTIGDGQGAIGEANVTVTVTVPNRPPVAQSDQAATIEGQPVTIDVLANDNDPDGNAIALAGMEMPGHGSLTLTPENRFIYTPSSGFVGQDSFTYTIRDSAGAMSRGDVRVEVAARNAPPTAVADNLVSGGEAVAFDPLANDSDPDGDPLQLKSLTLPISGRIALGADGRVTYTPPAGFSGGDGFTYQVGDGSTVSEAEVRVTVTAPAVATYGNGYRYRRRIVVPPQATTAEIAADFVLLVRESGSWLKGAASGGRVEHGQGYDLRFEFEDGTKLDHEIERYRSADGSLVAWVRIPAYQLASQLRLFLYYGKPGLSASEANPTGTWRGYLAVIDARTGIDRTSAGRAMTPSNVGSGELIGDAGLYAGSSVATRADAAFLSGLGALTVQALTVPDASMVGSSHGILGQGPMDGTDASAGLILQYLAQSGDGTPNVIHFKVACSDGASFVLSGTQTQSSGRQLLHGVWSRDTRARLYANGVELAASSTPVVRSGLTALPAGGLCLGAGARDPATGGWRGLLDVVRFAASAFSPARIAAEASNLNAIQALYGMGGEDEAGQSDGAPVAVPLATAATAGSSIDIDVAAKAYDPDGPGLAEIVGVAAPAHGLATVTGGKVRYSPFGGFVGRDQFEYTLDNAGKRSTSNILVVVNGAAATADRPKSPPAAVRTLRVPEDYATLSIAYAAAQSGDHISLANGTYAGNFTLNRNFGSTPVVIKSRSVNGPVFSGRLIVSGVGHWFHEIKSTYDATSNSDTGGAIHVSGSYFTLTRCWLTGRHGVTMAELVHHIYIGWSRFTGQTGAVGGCSHVYLALPEGSSSWMNINQGPHHIYIYRNFFFDVNSTRPHEDHYIYFGPSKVTNNIGQVPEGYVEYNLIYNDGTGISRARGIYLKRGAIVRYNDINVPQGAGSNGFRHSRGGEIYGNTIRNDDLNVNGGTASEHAIVYGNAVGGEIKLWAGSYNGTATNTAVEHQAADYCLLAGNRKLGGGSLPVSIGEHSDVLDTSPEAGGKVDHVTIYTGGFAHALTLIAGWYDAGSITNPPLAGWGSITPVTPITLQPEEVGQELADQR